MEKVPVRVINFADKSDKTAHDRMVKLVEQMLELHPKLAGARTPQEKTALERQIAATDTQIDALVYDFLRVDVGGDCHRGRNKMNAAEQRPIVAHGGFNRGFCSSTKTIQAPAGAADRAM